MGWVNDALAALSAGRAVRVQVFGGSMRGRIEAGDFVTLAPPGDRVLQVGDVVLVRWRGNYLLHLVVELEGARLSIGNNLGKRNGWVDRADVVGIVQA